MTQDAIRKRMDQAWAKAREELLRVMEGAPPDSIISGTEWQVREVHQQLARDCFQLMVQNKVDGLDQSPQGDFSPGGVHPAPRAAPDGQPRALGDHDQRRDRRRA